MLNLLFFSFQVDEEVIKTNSSSDLIEFFHSNSKITKNKYSDEIYSVKKDSLEELKMQKRVRRVLIKQGKELVKSGKRLDLHAKKCRETADKLIKQGEIIQKSCEKHDKMFWKNLQFLENPFSLEQTVKLKFKK